MNLKLSARQTRWLRLKAQRLLSPDSGPTTGPAAVIQQVMGVQAQDLPAGRLSVRARSTGLTDAGVEQARGEERSILWTWCMRGTLHLVTAEDGRWLIPFLGPRLVASNRRRASQLGWDEERAAIAIGLLQESLREHGALTRPEVVRLLQANHLPFDGQATVHLLYRAVLQGALCIGAYRGKQRTYTLADAWLGEWQTPPPEEALARIARRYWAGYGPATVEDLACWSGLKIRDARQAWQLVADQLVEAELDGHAVWLLKDQLPWLEEPFQSTVRLLPRFDTYLLGYLDRSLIVDPAYARRYIYSGGIIYPVLLVDGQALGTWKSKRKKAGLEVRVQPFEPLAAGLLPSNESEVADLGRFLGEKALLILEEPRHP
ncbi:MAG: winged helix DNA-binding domain-containing protein [Chloroflexi bacterium]|nr:winged helix DNA-binding domain-containing protein [Chloroflexota bacterium]